MTITKIRKARAGVPDKIGEGVRERKEIGGGRAGKEGDREASGKGKKSRGRAGKEGDREGTAALDACGSFAICHTVAIYIFRYICSLNKFRSSL